MKKKEVRRKRTGSVKSTTGAKPFPVVGIGGSAGGMEAFSRLLQNLRGDTGMAFVYIQHLDPDHESILAEILERKTRMSVQTAENAMHIHPNNVYVIPAGKLMSIVDGR